MLAGNFPATFSVEGVGDWRRGMAEMLDFGDVKEGGGTSRSKSSSLHASLFWLPCGEPSQAGYALGTGRCGRIFLCVRQMNFYKSVSSRRKSVL